MTLKITRATMNKNCLKCSVSFNGHGNSLYCVPCRALRRTEFNKLQNTPGTKQYEKKLASNLRYKKERPGWVHQMNARRNGKPRWDVRARHKRVKHAIPKMLSRAHRKQIREFYAARPPGHDVDHVIPLNAKNVCGLHVPWNLRYLPISINRNGHQRMIV